MTFSTKEALYDYLDSFNFAQYQLTPLSSVYFLVIFDGQTDALYFSHFDGVWFASPCTLQSFKMKTEDIPNFVDSIYEPESFDEALKHETIMHRGDYHYDIYCPQCAPFLPEVVEIIKPMTESECLDFLIKKSN